MDEAPIDRGFVDLECPWADPLHLNMTKYWPSVYTKRDKIFIAKYFVAPLGFLVNRVTKSRTTQV